jgi:hypothetical protein
MLTWIIEHVLLALPAWVWYAVSGIGAVIYFLSGIISAFLPTAPYAGIVKIIGGILLLAGVYLIGGAGVTALWQSEIKEMQNKVTQAEQKSATANSQLQTLIKEKTKVIYDTQIMVQEKIVKDSEKMDSIVIIDPVVIEDLNLAAGGKKILKFYFQYVQFSH